MHRTSLLQRFPCFLFFTKLSVVLSGPGRSAPQNDFPCPFASLNKHFFNTALIILPPSPQCSDRYHATEHMAYFQQTDIQSEAGRRVLCAPEVQTLLPLSENQSHAPTQSQFQSPMLPASYGCRQCSHPFPRYHTHALSGFSILLMYLHRIAEPLAHYRQIG